MAMHLAITVLMVGLLVMIVIFLCSMCYSFCWFWCNKRYRKKNMAKESAKVAKNAASSEGGITLENMTEKFQAKGSGQNPFYSVDMHCREEERQESMELRLVWLPTGKRHQQRQKRGNTMNHHETYTRNFADWLELVSYDVNNAIFLSGTNSLKKTEPLKNSSCKVDFLTYSVYSYHYLSHEPSSYAASILSK